ncbi:MAG TPA: DNA topoisomerase 3 [Pyrinomonadaceae bacterium]|nr:DNA topoisomerase 3 [Pyrinomonadaceae bacterium]
MSKQLIIAEKPSVAREIAKALGNPVKEDGYLQVNEFIVTNCVGHLFSICDPKEHNPNWEQWSLNTLPMLPDTFKYKANPATLKQWKIVKELLGRNDVTSVVNACDAGREGELIFWLAYNHANIRKAVKRLWISSLTKESILSGFEELKDASEYQGLTDSAFLRQMADWFIGLNATRAFTLVARQPGQVFSLGRVQTPTLALIVNRDNDIDNFTSKPYWQIKGDFLPEGLSAWLCNEKLQTINFDTKTDANSVENQVRSIKAAPVILKLDKKEVSIKQPLLFDLTSLQRELNKSNGYTAAKTLEVAQSLYEKKLLTYPRTSSAFLSQTVADKDIPAVLESLRKSERSEFAKCAEKIKLNIWNSLTSRHVDDKKVTDHHAIIPTSEKPNFENLSKEEIAVYETVILRFLAAFYPPGKDERTTLVIGLEKFMFVARGVIRKELGWREVLNITEEYETESEENEDAAKTLPEINQNSSLGLKEISNIEKKTKPPARFNENSLLAAMETAGKMLDDDEARQAMKDCGLGTPATRAETIEKLIRQSYLERKAKQLVSTSKARQLIKSLQQINSILVSPELTGNWEKNLEFIAQKKAQPQSFESNVRKLATKIVDDIAKSGVVIVDENPDYCPKCQSRKRNGTLKTIKSKSASGGSYLVCSLGKDDCGYISLVPQNKSQKTSLLTKNCPTCKSALSFRVSKEKKIPYLACISDGCKGIVWFEKPKPKKKGGK